MRLAIAILTAIACSGCVVGPSTIFVPSHPVISRCPDVSGVVMIRAVLKIAGKPRPVVSIGTAFVVHRDGEVVYAVTCQHCIAGALPGSVLVDNKPATVWAADADVDLAMVRWKSWFPHRVYSLGAAELGQTVWAAGFPDTQKDEPRSMTSGGCILHVRRGTVSWLRHNMLGFDGGACHGFSGGPLLTSEGTVVGIIESAKAMDTIIGRMPIPSFAVAIRSKHARPLMAAIPP